MTHIFQTSTKLSDMIDANFRLLRVLTRIGVDLQYCDHSIGQACLLSGVDPKSTLMICNAHSLDGYTPSDPEMEGADAETVMKYLHDSHIYYNMDALVKLEKTVDELMEAFPQKQKEIVARFVKGYKDELASHFGYEENELFPYIRSLAGGNRDNSYCVDIYAEKHENAETKLRDLKNIIMRYLPGSCDNELRARCLTLIYHLEDDLHYHTTVENGVLVPMTKRMEENGQ